MESVVRLAFVSDIHGNLAALEAVIADLQQRQVDQVVNLGDTLSGPLLPQETAQRLRALPWRHVAGNHERQVLSLPLHRQNPSDAYTSAQLSPENRDWIQTHAAPCASDLHHGQRWADRLGTDARYAIAEKVSGSWSCQLLSLPYDHEAMAQLAEQRGRTDWAHALRTGRMPRRAK